MPELFRVVLAATGASVTGDDLVAKI